ncbi:hypothetical protein ACROYT_G015111 [Oculina patagonica]
MAQRQSRRVRGLEPEVGTFKERCFFCLSDISLGRVACPSIRRLPCCLKFVHTRCQIQWQETHTTCAHCMREIVQPAAQIWNPPEAIRAIPQREVARQALILYRESETAFRYRVTPEEKLSQQAKAKSLKMAKTALVDSLKQSNIPTTPHCVGCRVISKINELIQKRSVVSDEAVVLNAKLPWPAVIGLPTAFRIEVMKALQEKDEGKFTRKLRCKCGRCSSHLLPNPNEIEECVSCLSSDIVLEEVGSKPNCVTEHPGFSQVCLQRWSLRLAADKNKTKEKTKYRQTGSENSLVDNPGAILFLDPNHVHEAITNRLLSDDFELLGPADQLDLMTQGFCRNLLLVEMQRRKTWFSFIC